MIVSIKQLLAEDIDMADVKTFTVEQSNELTNCLVKVLRAGIENTIRRDEWTQRNLSLLREFARQQVAQSYPSERNGPAEEKARQFLWDFIAYLEGKGVLLAAETEFDDHKHELLRDFEKLLYVRSPLKLMMCRVDGEVEANQIKSWLKEFMIATCSWFSPGEVFILYCVYWAEPAGANRDFVYAIRLNGDLNYIAVTTEEFEPV